MTSALTAELYRRIDALPIVDIHTHVEWKTGTAASIGDILSYHYYTELTNSAEFQEGKFPFDDPEALTRQILPKLRFITNTVQYDWLMTISREYLGIAPSQWQPENWKAIYDRSVEVMGRSEWRQEMIEQSKIVNASFHQPVQRRSGGVGPVLLLALPAHRALYPVDRSRRRAGGPRRVPRPPDPHHRRFRGRHRQDVREVRAARHGLCGHVDPLELSDLRGGRRRRPARVLDKAVSGSELDACEKELWGAWAMDRMCDACRKFDRPFHLMIGVNRDVYAHGVPMGMDLFDSVNSMAGYEHILNKYVDVKFPTAVLADTSGLELTAAAWIRHNVYPSGHWWYSNQPTDIAREVRRRINAVPQNKIIGYFSDAYYLEFILPKFRMYKFELASALAERMERSLVHPNMEPFSLDDAMILAEKMLVKNPAEIIGIPGI